MIFFSSLEREDTEYYKEYFVCKKKKGERGKIFLK